MNALGENVASQNADKIRRQFHKFLTKANKERPHASDLQALNDLLHNNKEMELWRAVVGMANLGHAESSPLERLLIQQVTLCWLNLNLTEYRHTNVMKQSISLAQGIYWDKRLSMAQRQFTRACESLARVRRLLHRNPVQVNIAAHGGQQVNVLS